MSKPYDVKVGQTYKDNDKRIDRTLTIVRIATPLHPDGFEPYAVCTIGATGRTTKIKLRRFRPNSTGYVLIRDEYGKPVL